MPLDGNGNYTLPTGNPVVTNTVISSTVHNNTLTDIKNTLSNVIYKDGQATPTANIKMGGFKHTGLAAGTTAGDSVRYEDALGAGKTVTAGKVLGRDTSGNGVVQELPIAVDASGNVGIGTSSPSNLLHIRKDQSAIATYGLVQNDGSVSSTTYAGWMIQDGSTVVSGVRRQRDGGSSATQIGAFAGTAPLALWAGDAERARIDTSGNVGIGTSSPNAKLDVAAINPTVRVNATAGGTPTLSLFSNGVYDWAIQGGTALKFMRDSTEFARIDSSGNFFSGDDNTKTLGSASKRWSTVYAGTGTINTSDAREKTEIKKLTTAEIKAAKEIGKEIGIYQFLASVKEKGDKARHHVGMTVQRVIEILESNALNPNDYGFICHDAWKDEFVDHPAIEAKDAVLNDAGELLEAAIEAKDAWTEQTQKAGDRYGFRYDQLMMFIAAGFEARLSELESK